MHYSIHCQCHRYDIATTVPFALLLRLWQIGALHQLAQNLIREAAVTLLYSQHQHSLKKEKENEWNCIEFACIAIARTHLLTQSRSRCGSLRHWHCSTKQYKNETKQCMHLPHTILCTNYPTSNVCIHTHPLLPRAIGVDIIWGDDERTWACALRLAISCIHTKGD